MQPTLSPSGWSPAPRRMTRTPAALTSSSGACTRRASFRISYAPARHRACSTDGTRIWWVTLWGTAHEEHGVLRTTRHGASPLSAFRGARQLRLAAQLDLDYSAAVMVILDLFARFIPFQFGACSSKASPAVSVLITKSHLELMCSCIVRRDRNIPRLPPVELIKCTPPDPFIWRWVSRPHYRSLRHGTRKVLARRSDSSVASSSSTRDPIYQKDSSSEAKHGTLAVFESKGPCLTQSTAHEKFGSFFLENVEDK
ncbi:hypothetical protein DFH09DRAFT_1097662 [Mycena vulgaris]|nr:hypothetical protein DFH09DRAFT_1097662 [Mycena vulgaris]